MLSQNGEFINMILNTKIHTTVLYDLHFMLSKFRDMFLPSYETWV